jgi:hypothetical protein
MLQEVDSSKYLGVTISKDLRWDDHINTITAKANRTLGFLRRNMKGCRFTLVGNSYHQTLFWMEGHLPSILPFFHWVEVVLQDLCIPIISYRSKQQAVIKKSTPANILELPLVKTYDGMITSTPSLPRPIEHWVSWDVIWEVANLHVGSYTRGLVWSLLF